MECIRGNSAEGMQPREFGRGNSIEVIQSEADKGFYSPLQNQINTLLQFKDSNKIDGVMYVHDDGIMNVTELSQGKVCNTCVLLL